MMCHRNSAQIFQNLPVFGFCPCLPLLLSRALFLLIRPWEQSGCFGPMWHRMLSILFTPKVYTASTGMCISISTHFKIFVHYRNCGEETSILLESLCETNPKKDVLLKDTAEESGAQKSCQVPTKISSQIWVYQVIDHMFVPVPFT